MQYEFIYRQSVLYLINDVSFLSRYLAVDMISETFLQIMKKYGLLPEICHLDKMGNRIFLYAYITGYFISVRHLYNHGYLNEKQSGIAHSVGNSNIILTNVFICCPHNMGQFIFLCTILFINFKS